MTISLTRDSSIGRTGDTDDRECRRRTNRLGEPQRVGAIGRTYLLNTAGRGRPPCWVMADAWRRTNENKFIYPEILI